jgi:hypothetical protein
MNRKKVTDIYVLFIYTINNCGYIPKEKQFYLFPSSFILQYFYGNAKRKNSIAEKPRELSFNTFYDAYI